jgi:hypothetical protein
MIMDKEGYIIIGSSDESKKILIDLLVENISCIRFGGQGEATIDEFKNTFMHMIPTAPESYLVLENVDNGFELVDVIRKLNEIKINMNTGKPHLAEKNIISCCCTFNQLKELKAFDYMMRRYAVIDTDLPVTKELTDYLKNKKN